MDPALEMRFARLVFLLLGNLDLAERVSGRKGRMTDESVQ
jgi:hypothetical protein